MTISNNATKDQAISLITQGLSTTQIALACGVSESYISQLRSDPAVAEAYGIIGAGGASGAELSSVDKAFDSKLEQAESLALDRIERSLGFANMGQALMAFKILNGARKRKDGNVPGVTTGVTVNVSLTLPATASARYVTNSSNEIVEVEGKTMISATAKSLDSILAARAQANAPALPAVTQLERAASRLDGLSVPAARATRRIPSSLAAGTALSADIL